MTKVTAELAVAFVLLFLLKKTWRLDVDFRRNPFAARVFFVFLRSELRCSQEI